MSDQPTTETAGSVPALTKEQEAMGEALGQAQPPVDLPPGYSYVPPATGGAMPMAYVPGSVQPVAYMSGGIQPVAYMPGTAQPVAIQVSLI